MQGQPGTAIPVARAVLSQPNRAALPTTRTSSHVWAHAVLGVALTQQGQREVAIAHYRRAVQLDPTFAPAQQGLQALQNRAEPE